MAESDRRTTGASAPTRIDGANDPRTHFAKDVTADGKLRLVERLRDDVGVIISRQYVLGISSDADQHHNLLVITTGKKDDTILIDQPKIGTLDVRVNGKQYLISLGLGQELAINSRDGNDTILATPRVTTNMIVNAGIGKDIVATAQGNDHAEGGADDDILLLRGGNDLGRGGHGNDFLDLGSGDDVGRGNHGNDKLRGGLGNDFLDGSEGNNTLDGNAGKDVLFVSRERDQVHSNKADRVVNRDGIDPSLGSSIKIVGTPTFRTRVEADIDLLRSLSTGQQMLTELDRVARDTGKSVTLGELTYEQNGTASGSRLASLQNTPRGVVPGTADNATIGFNPSYFNPTGYAPGFLPAVVLFHELSHAYNIVTGTLQPGIYVGSGIDKTAKVDNSERQAVGLSNSGFKYDFDGDSNTPKTTANPTPLTEEAIRKELKLPPRLTYTRPPTPVGSALGSTPRAKDPVENLIDRIYDAALANDPVALQKAQDDLRTSVHAQDFRSPAAEPPTQAPKTQQNSRSR